MDANAKAILRARQIAQDYIRRLGDWSDEKAISKAIEYMGEIYHLLNDPPRNCDVGTAEEQSMRFENYCFKHRTRERCCGDCPVKDAPCCELAWAQMLYE